MNMTAQICNEEEENMPTVHSSPEVIREMKSQLTKTISELRATGQKVQNAHATSSDWNDETGEQYRALMQRIGRLVESPIDTLQAALPKLEKLAQSLDQYGSIKF